MTISTLTEMLDKVISETLKGIGTSIPAHVLEFDVATQQAKVQIAIEFRNTKGESFSIAPIVNVPVYFAGGNAFHIEHQIDPDDEGILVVSQRCIDGWKEQGGISPQTVLRKLDMQDSIFIPGVRSKPNAITSFLNDGVVIRNKDGSHYIHLKKTGDIFLDNASCKANFKNNGDIVLENSLCTFTILADGSIKGNNASGYFELMTSGTFNINTATIDPNGNILTPGSITGTIITDATTGVKLFSHTHAGGGIPPPDPGS